MSLLPVEGPIPPVYPENIKQFPVYADYTDIDYAANDNVQNSEITAIETALGVNPQGPFPTVAAFLLNLYAGTKPLAHTHAHDPTAPDGMALTDLGNDTHAQYMPINPSIRTPPAAFQTTVGGIDPVNNPDLTTKHYVDAEDQHYLQISEQYAYAQAQSAIQISEAYTDQRLLDRYQQLIKYGMVWTYGGIGWQERFLTYFEATGALVPAPNGDNGVGYVSGMGPLKMISGTLDGVIGIDGDMQLPTDYSIFQQFVETIVLNLVWVPPNDPRRNQYPNIPVVDFTSAVAAPFDMWMGPPGTGANLNIIVRRFDGSYPVGYFCKIAYIMIGV